VGRQFPIVVIASSIIVFHAAHRAPSRARRRHHGNDAPCSTRPSGLSSTRHRHASLLRTYGVRVSSRSASWARNFHLPLDAAAAAVHWRKLSTRSTCFARSLALSVRARRLLCRPSLGPGSGVGTLRTGRSSNPCYGCLILHARWGGMCASAASQPRDLRQHRHDVGHSSHEQRGLRAAQLTAHGPGTRVRYCLGGTSSRSSRSARCPIRFFWQSFKDVAAPTAPTERAGGGLSLKVSVCYASHLERPRMRTPLVSQATLARPLWLGYIRAPALTNLLDLFKIFSQPKVLKNSGKIQETLLMLVKL